jgi:hypothetical protein
MCSKLAINRMWMCQLGHAAAEAAMMQHNTAGSFVLHAAAHLRCCDICSQLWWCISSQQLPQQPIKRLAAFIVRVGTNGPYEAEQEVALQQWGLLLLRQIS